MQLAALMDHIAPTFFPSLATVWLWAFVVGAFVCLTVGADRAVEAAAKLASSLGMSKALIGATVVSLGTTMPEACVSVLAAFAGKPGMALGNGVGSVVFNAAMIFGLCGTIRQLPKDRFLLDRHGWIQFGAAVLLMAIMLAGWAWSGDIHRVYLTRPIGLLLLGLLAVYMVRSVRWARKHPQLLPEELAEEIAEEGSRNPAVTVAINLIVLLVGLAVVVAGSEMMVGSVTEICLRYEVPPEVISLTVVALGTSLPELVTGITSLIKGHAELLVGNVIGANILNILFVVGASSAAVDLQVKPTFFWLYVPAMVLVLGWMRLAGSLPGRTFRRWQCLPLVVVYIAFDVLTFLFGRGGA